MPKGMGYGKDYKKSGGSSMYQGGGYKRAMSQGMKGSKTDKGMSYKGGSYKKGKSYK